MKFRLTVVAHFRAHIRRADRELSTAQLIICAGGSTSTSLKKKECCRDITWLWRISFASLFNGTRVYNMCVCVYCLYVSMDASVPSLLLLTCLHTSAIHQCFVCLLAGLRCVWNILFVAHDVSPDVTCCRSWRPPRGSPGLRVVVSVFGNMVGPASWAPSGAGRRAWSCPPLQRGLPCYRRCTHRRQYPASPTGRSSNTSRLRLARWPVEVNPLSRRISLRWVRHNTCSWKYCPEKFYVARHWGIVEYYKRATCNFCSSHACKQTKDSGCYGDNITDFILFFFCVGNPRTATARKTELPGQC